MLINSSHVKMCQSYRALLLHDIEKSCIIMVNTLKKLSLVLCEYLGRCPDLPRYPDYKAEQVAGLQPFSPPTTFQHHPHHPIPNTSPRHDPTHLPDTSPTPPRHTLTHLPATPQPASTPPTPLTQISLCSILVIYCSFSNKNV